MLRIATIVGVFVLLSSGCFVETDDSGRDGAVTDAGGGGDDAGIGDAGTTDAGGGGNDAGPGDSGLGDAGESDGGGNPCLGLDLPACRQDPVCEPDLCFACSCTPSYEGCRYRSDPPFLCPEFGCPMPMCCQETRECGNQGATCEAPGTSPGCGTCSTDPGNCAEDFDCATGEICEPLDCSCEGATVCVPGCTSDADCAQGETCSNAANPRCEPTACAVTTDCPLDFDCQASECRRRRCSSDLDCDHFCISGACHQSFGQCAYPVP